MKTYKVVLRWDINVDAETELEAVEIAEQLFDKNEDIFFVAKEVK